MDHEVELPAQHNPFGRKHLLRQLAIPVALAAALLGALILVRTIAERMVQAPYDAGAGETGDAPK